MKSPVLVIENYHKGYMVSARVRNNQEQSWSSKLYRIVGNVHIWLNVMLIFRKVLTNTWTDRIFVN